MLINGERSLAHVVYVDEIKPLEGYDRVEYARTAGWWVVVAKAQNLHVGDKCIYFEIDSKVPATDERFKFLEPKKYRIKTQKMCKVYSQGLLMPLSEFPELGDPDVGTDVTKKLGVTYYVAADNKRKATLSKIDILKRSKPKFFRNPLVKWLMRFGWFRGLVFALFGGKKKAKKYGFPTFIKKTDEDRVENQPFRVGDGKEYILTEKLDGCSCTYALERKGKKKFEYYVCSRNVRLFNENQRHYVTDHGGDNIYWEMSKKYDIEKHLRQYLDNHPECSFVCIQGEGVGNVQGNPLQLTENDLYVFNLIDSQVGRYGSYEGKKIINSWGMKWVPILGYGKTQDTMEELKEFADGKSVVNPKVMREGIVYRTPDGKDSFKNVSRKYLLKHADDEVVGGDDVIPDDEIDVINDGDG